jgi:hypothetical protein
MKKLLVLLVLLWANSAQAQNYQCLQGGVAHYFINGHGYLRGIRVDSVVTSGSDVLYYPYRTRRKKSELSYYEDTVMGCWLGGRVVMKPDGVFLFDNYWRDTVIIKTNASIGDSWIFYDDTSSASYWATVTGMDTMTVLGVLDSIKTITIHAFASGVPSPSDPVDNFQIQLSKEHGFVKVFDLYTFPYHFTTAGDLYYNWAQVAHNPGYGGVVPFESAMHFQIVDFQNPALRDIFDFNTGDVFEWKISSNSGSAPVYNYTNYSGIQANKILSRSTPDPYHVQYQTEIKAVINAHQTHTGINTTDVKDSVETQIYDTSVLFSSLVGRMPEDALSTKAIYYYVPVDTYCVSTPLYAIIYLESLSNFSSIYKQVYKTKFGQVYNNKQIFYGFGSGFEGHVATNVISWLIYSLKDGIECGTYFNVPISVASLSVDNSIKIFPNPVKQELTVAAAENITSIVISNIIGQTVYSHTYNSKEVKVDVADLPDGIYFLRLNGTTLKRFVKE